MVWSLFPDDPEELIEDCVDDVEGDGDDRARKMLKTLNGKGNSGVRGGITGKGRGKSGRLSADDIEEIDDSHTNGHGDGSGAKEEDEMQTNGSASASASTGKRSSSVETISSAWWLVWKECYQIFSGMQS